MLTEATRANLERKAAYADPLHLHDGVPVFSWVDLNVTELCNRSAGSPKACRFCPRIDPAFYPNQRLHMPIGMARKIGDELRALPYHGAIALCGFGEPLLHPEILAIVGALAGLRVEIITNGDRLTPAMIAELYEAGANYLVVSLYDGPEQVERMHQMFEAAGRDQHDYVLRDRWYDDGADFGLKLTNRAGTIHVGSQAPVPTGRPCHYPAYQLTVDWNGDVLLCVQDWNKRLRFGNVQSQSLWSIWTSPALSKRRTQLLRGDRSGAPCSACNADGCLHGTLHAEAWRGAR
jgi:radical SAM protein with 4Fe4S-binding SPASM domain